MFNKKKCPKCKESIEETFEFCPSCGNRLKNTDGDFGMLGRNDFTPTNNLMMPGFGELFNTIFQGLSRELNPNEINQEKIIKQTKNPNMKGISISISTSPGKAPKIKVNQYGQAPQKQAVSRVQRKVKVLPMNELKKFKDLPLEEPKTNMRRIEDSIIYEIELPGITSEKDISILNLGNTIEIKAVSQDKAYQKNLSLGLPVIDYSFSKGLLVLELEAKN